MANKAVTTQKRQFKAGPKTRTFYDRKIQRPGSTTTIALGKVIPKDWQYVRITNIKKTTNEITITLQKLLGGEKNEPRNGNNKTKQI